MLEARTAPTEVSLSSGGFGALWEHYGNCRCYGRERFMAMPEWVKSELRANFARASRAGRHAARAEPRAARAVYGARDGALHMELWESLDLDLSVMKLTHHLTAACLLLVGSSAAAPRGDSEFIRITPDDVHWVDVPGGHGAQMAALQGNPDKLEPYVIRAKFPPYVMDRPHWHPNARYVTVLQGTWYAGTGHVFDVKHAVPMPPGSFMVHPARALHWDGSATDETVIVQITGYGPGTTTPANPRQPLWVEVSH